MINAMAEKFQYILGRIEVIHQQNPELNDDLRHEISSIYDACAVGLQAAGIDILAEPTPKDEAWEARLAHMARVGLHAAVEGQPVKSWIRRVWRQIRRPAPPAGLVAVRVTVSYVATVERVGEVTVLVPPDALGDAERLREAVDENWVWTRQPRAQIAIDEDDLTVTFLRLATAREINAIPGIEEYEEYTK
ncbi:hypothetical protein [Streptomyces sp. CBMA156]|uniref:hypothetical protein n=1 Tax=Streptomyces sp. CBMA156 TaxID=1930280 RepID=UPI001661CE30|nr:hypothetical protein [Streptomyces sp. CBMA156]MBD0670036.1 hypothetical protein [Streptomyces sp. CBMA156]